METQNPTSGKETPATVQGHFGLTADKQIVVLPDAEYPAGAVHLYSSECEAENETPLQFTLILNDLQYRAIISHVAAELKDIDGDGLIPQYMVITMSGEQPIFLHASVDNDEDANAFLETCPMEVTGPILLKDVCDHWPKNADEAAAFLEAREESSQ